MDADRAAPRLGNAATDAQHLREVLMRLHPWRKGPLELGGVLIDTEWRSDWKWERIRPFLNLENQRVLDIGCGNGYFGWRMLAAGARLVVGIDPTLVFVMQWLACRHFAGNVPNFVLPLGIEDLPAGPASFDAVFSMGVLYHRRNPVEHLEQIRALLRPAGALVLETLVMPNETHGAVLVPSPRYARMRNVWAIPTIDSLLGWVTEAGFKKPRLIDVSATTTAEQRSTEWMRFDSLAEALDPADATQTLEGYPTPTRALLLARR
jgi:tRNA (mo5U34)-methyltransferase